MKCVLRIMLIVITLSFTTALFALTSRESYNFVPEPQLLYPVTDNIDLSKNEDLEFKWINMRPISLDYCYLRLYKGYQTYESNLILKEQIPAPESTFTIKKDQLEVDQVYTWTLQEVSLGGQKSDKAYSPFKIIKK